LWLLGIKITKLTLKTRINNEDQFPVFTVFVLFGRISVFFWQLLPSNYFQTLAGVVTISPVLTGLGV
jgi:hypothetical protein